MCELLDESENALQKYNDYANDTVFLSSKSF